MNAAPRLLALGLLLYLPLLGCEEAPPDAGPDIVAYCGPGAAAIEARIDRVLASLTREQKVSLTRGDFIRNNAWVVDGVPEAGVPPLAMVDGPRGVGKLAGRGTAFPVGMARGATWDPALERRVGEAMGREVRAHGIGVILAPTMNILRHPRWGRAQETYGEDPLHMARLAGAFIEGAQTQVLATAKHYAVNSIEATRFSVDVTVDERTLREIYLPHFEHVVKRAHVAAVMSAYNSVNGAFCSENDPLLRQVLKGEWGFSGFVVSDWLYGTHDTVAAAQAGLDLEMPVGKIYGDRLLAAVEQGSVDASLLDDMNRRLLRGIYCHRLDQDPPAMNEAELETPATLKLAREVAERSLVLLSNTGGALPLPRAAGTRIAVLGPLADVANLGDMGSSAVLSSAAVTPLEGLLAHRGPATITHLAAGPADAEARATLAAADAVVIVAGLTAMDEGEGAIAAGDRDSLGLRPADVALIQEVAALSGRVIVVLEGGAAITMDDFLPEVEAVLFAWYPGAEGGHAIARALFGDVNPSGRLPIVFPRSEADLQPFDNTSNAVDYGYFHGFRHLDRQGAAPLFPFGFGLSYTSFRYAGLSLLASRLSATDVLRVSVEVTNTGPVAGRETVQVYIGPQQTAISPRFVRDLRGFQQVDLPPGGAQTVTLEIPVASLGYWNPKERRFVVEPTTYLVEVGSSSRDLPLSATLTIP